MSHVDHVSLRHPQTLMRSRAPWASILYLVLQAVAGVVSLGVVFTVLLIPVWLFAWPRAEARLLPLASRPALRVARRPGQLCWQDVVLVLLTAVMAVAMFFVGIVLVVVIGTLFATPVAVLAGREATWGIADQVIPPLLVVIVFPMLGLIVLFLALWALTALAYGWSGLSTALLRDEESRLAAQVEALGDMTVQLDDSVALERRVLERNLHDGAQMHLSAAGLRLAMLQLEAEHLSEGELRSTILSGLDEVREQLDLGGQSVRNAVSGLVPTVLRDGGLQAAIAELARAVPLETTTECTVPRLPMSLEHSIHLIAHEAITNVVRHSGAQTVSIRCTLDDPMTTGTPSFLRLQIADDGRGGAVSTGTGLISMRARARSQGGVLTLDSPEGGPTIVDLKVPVTADREDG
ncbi:sensor histidine kinase [Brachybacterium sp. 107]|uniref:sensor histidine kinase n=1 Tax=Brachybacterium sp. 107 TaxID=3457736 RepID=UPI00403459F5